MHKAYMDYFLYILSIGMNTVVNCNMNKRIATDC
jgi:hypothetical protein